MQLHIVPYTMELTHPNASWRVLQRVHLQAWDEGVGGVGEKILNLSLGGQP